MDSINQLFEYKKVFVDSYNTCPPPLSIFVTDYTGGWYASRVGLVVANTCYHSASLSDRKFCRYD